MCSAECYHRLVQRSVYLCVILLGSVCADFTHGTESTQKDAKDMACNNVKYAYSAKGFNNNDVPQTPIAGAHLRICSGSLTCCTADMEHRLSTHSRAEFDRLLRDSVGQVRSVFAQQAHKFDEFFKELLLTSKRDFHEMFLRTYGLLYDRNSHIFRDLFADLERYYLTGGVDLSAALAAFFDRLYRKMFQVLNSQYTFSESYMTCISEKMDALKPFGDVPAKLNVEVKRSFVATRTFVQALGIGRDVLKFVQEVGPTPECSRALMRMSYCGHCSGLPDIQPCGSYCLNVMRGCLAYHADLHSEWSSYINELLMLASRLESSFNIESVVDPIDIKISDAIMNFQENGQTVSQELFRQCGKPRLGRRDARHELNFETLRFAGQGGAAARPTTAAGTSLDRLVAGIRQRVRRTRGFWRRLSQDLCGRVAGGSLPLEHCWNGLRKDKYTLDLMGEGLANQSRNPEVSLDISRQNSLINQQILTLKLITTKLRHAYNGLDVEWQDASDSDWSSSGSGSGSGFGEEEPTDSFGDIYFSTPSAPPRYIPERKPPPKISSAASRWQHETFLSVIPLWSIACVLVVKWRG